LDASSLQDSEDQQTICSAECEDIDSGRCIKSSRTQMDNIARLTGRHFPIKKSPEERAKGKSPKKMCRVCYARGKKTVKGREVSTVWVCGDCPSKPGLHVDEGCFKIYHTQLNFAH
jgi:hypothetical protein